jgi:hypothetical protein
MRLRGGEDLRADLGDGDVGDIAEVVSSFVESFCLRSEGGIMPFVMGAGMSRVSVALRASWREKSLACHHSRNLSAKIEAGRK